MKKVYRKVYCKSADIFCKLSNLFRKKQDSWDGFIPIPPNMAMKIVSAKRGLKSDLKKMEEVWMPAGVDVGVVGYADNYGRYLKK